jgi:hypothetical protein
MDALIAALGTVDTERFICMIKRDTFDYTEWQRGLWADKSIEEIHSMATENETAMKCNVAENKWNNMVQEKG